LKILSSHISEEHFATMTDHEAGRSATVGTGSDALEWITASNVPEYYRVDLIRFVQNFPSLSFRKDDDEALDQLESVDGVRLPAVLREVLKTVAFLHPLVEVRFDHFEYDSPRSDRASRSWYAFERGSMDDEHRALVCEKAKIYPVAFSSETANDFLAIDVSNAWDERVFDFSYEGLMDNAYEGRSLRPSIYPVFDSYPRMLSCIRACKLDDGTIVETQ
jgi:hypothetical protein